MEENVGGGKQPLFLPPLPPGEAGCRGRRVVGGESEVVEEEEWWGKKGWGRKRSDGWRKVGVDKERWWWRKKLVGGEREVVEEGEWRLKKESRRRGGRVVSGEREQRKREKGAG